MTEQADHRTAVGRRADRIPFDARREFKLSAAAAKEGERLYHRTRAQALLRRESVRRREAALRSTAARGGNVAPCSVLHSVCAIRPPDGSPIADTGSMGEAVLAHFGMKWSCSEAAARERVDTLLSTLGDVEPEWAQEDVVEAVSQLRRPAQVDETGICARALQLFSVARPSAVLCAVKQIGSGCGSFVSFRLRGVALGKKSDTPTVQKVRMLLPLTVWMTVFGCLLAKALRTACDALPPISLLWECGVAGSCSSARGLGALTGSRTAGALGRFVLRGLAEHLSAHRARSAVTTFERMPMLLASHLDNLVLLGTDASAAERSFEAALEYLQAAWHLDLPIDETEVMVPRAASVLPRRLRVAHRCNLLGHIVDANASTMPCWRHARKIVLGHCAAQMRVARKAHVPQSVRLAALDRVLWPALQLRAPSWAPTTQVRTEVDALQRRCVAMAISVARLPLEEAGAYRRRRGRVAAAALAETRPWSQRVVDAARQRMLVLRDEAQGARTWLGAVFALGTPAGSRSAALPPDRNPCAPAAFAPGSHRAERPRDLKRGRPRRAES